MPRRRSLARGSAALATFALAGCFFETESEIYGENVELPAVRLDEDNPSITFEAFVCADTDDRHVAELTLSPTHLGMGPQADSDYVTMRVETHDRVVERKSPYPPLSVSVEVKPACEDGVLLTFEYQGWAPPPGDVLVHPRVTVTIPESKRHDHSTLTLEVVDPRDP